MAVLFQMQKIKEMRIITHDAAADIMYMNVDVTENRKRNVHITLAPSSCIPSSWLLPSGSLSAKRRKRRC